MGSLEQTAKVGLVVGASRGIGRQIAIDLARAGFNVVVAAKSISNETDKQLPFPPDPNSPESTISTVAREITTAGQVAVPVQVDTRSEESINQLVATTVSRFGRLDLVVYNAGAVWWSSVENTPVRRFKLMQEVNINGLYACVTAALPHFKANGWKGRIVVVSPPIYSRFFRGKTAYAIGKVGMSVLTTGLAMDWEREGRSEMAITSIWPAAAVDSGATREPGLRAQLRKPTIMSDAVLAIVKADPRAVNGRLLIDEDFLRESAAITDFSHYSLVPGSSPRRMMPATFPDLTVTEQDDEGDRRDSTLLRAGEKSRL